jgi:hypothetical protein
MKSLKRMARLINERAVHIGSGELEGFQFESFDASLLRVGDGDLNEHVDAQASGQLYYGILTRKALENLRGARLVFENWYSKVYNECNELIKSETSIKRPNKVDVENRVKEEYAKKYEKYSSILVRKEYVYERLNLFYSAWITKGFSLSDLTARKSREIGRNTRGLIGGTKKGEEDEEE